MATLLTWLGHATWLIKTGQHTLLVDPFLDDSPTASCQAADLNPDFILVTHGHQDHMADAGPIAARCGATLISNFEICQWYAKHFKVKNIHPMNTGGTASLPFGKVKLTIAHHSSTFPDGSPAGSPNGFLLQLADGNVYIAGDTSLFFEMEYYGRAGLAVAILPIGDTYTMGLDESIDAINLLKPQRVAPSHYNTWDVIAQDAQVWAARVQQETKAKPVVLQPGQGFEIGG